MEKSCLIPVDIAVNNFFSKVLFLLLGEKLQQLEEQKGIVIRFTIGHR
jgi:hypothetical protein